MVYRHMVHCNRPGLSIENHCMIEWVQDWHLPHAFLNLPCSGKAKSDRGDCSNAQESSMDTLRSIAHICTVCPLLLQLCSRALQHGLHCPSELLLCLSAMVDDRSPFIR